MADGISLYLADKWLNMLGAVAFTAPTNVYLKLHTGAPGSAGTTYASAVTTRNVLTVGSATTNTVSMTVGNFSMTTSETISDVSFWDASTAGNFLWSAPLTTPVPVINGSTLSFSSISIGFTATAS